MKRTGSSMMLATMLASGLMLAAGRASATPRAPGRSSDRPKTVFLPSPDNPLVALRIFFHVGSVDDPRGKQGLAALTAEMVGRGGTQARRYAEVLDALYPMAAHIRVYADKESAVFEGTVHRDHLEAFAELIAQQILTPRFAEEDFKRNRQDAADYVAKTLRGSADEDLGKQAMAALLFAGHPYGTPSAGTVAGLSAITLDDVRQFYQAHYARQRLIVGVAGGYPDGFAERFAHRFDALPAAGVPLPALPPPPARKGNQVLIVEKEARADAISIGHAIDVSRADADFYPLAVARSYLGEHRTFSGILMNELRGLRGLNYGDYAYVENFIQEGWSTFGLPNIPRRQQHFEIWLRPVPPQNSVFALRAALFYTDRLIREGIPAPAFAATRTFLMNYTNLWTQDVSRRLGYAIDAAITGKDIIRELQARLPGMKKADVDRAVRKHLSVSNLAIAIVSGNPAALQAQLLSGQPTPITYDTQGTPAEVLARDRLIEKYPLGVGKGAVRVVKAEEMFER